jgi:hypothetical protein
VDIKDKKVLKPNLFGGLRTWVSCLRRASVVVGTKSIVGGWFGGESRDVGI